MVSGVMDLPAEAKNIGGNPSWVGYVEVDDVDATANRIKSLGGAVYVPPTDMPNISRFPVQLEALLLAGFQPPEQSEFWRFAGQRRSYRLALF